MDINTSTETITRYTITLTDAEVGEILADPAPFQKQLRELRAENAKGKHGARNFKLGRKPRQHLNGTAKERANGAGPLDRVDCPECHLKIASKFLANHRQKKHGVARVSKKYAVKRDASGRAVGLAAKE